MTKAKPIVVMTDAIAKMPAGDKRHAALQALKPAVEQRLYAVNGKASSFCTTLHCEVAAIVRDAEQRLAATGLPRSAWTGVVVSHTGAGPTAKRYKYSAAATWVQIERRTKDWVLVGVCRDMVFPGSNERLTLTISDTQADEIKRRAVAAFIVQPTQAATNAH
jgi:hypothetical protein